MFQLTFVNQDGQILETNLKKNLNKRQLKSGQAAAKIKKYKYEDLLQFLVIHIQDRQVIENISNDSEPEETLQDYTDTPTTALTDTSTTALTDTSTTALTDTSTPEILPRNPSISTTSLNSPQNITAPTTPSHSSQNANTVKKNQARARAQKQASSQPSASASLMKYIIENKKHIEEDDHIDAFFKGLIPTIKTFSPYYQHSKRKNIPSCSGFRMGTVEH